MEFDIRYRSYTFKHSYSEKPDMSQERFREHFHTSYELLYFMRGDADIMLQHTRYSIRPRSLLVIKPGEYHNIVFHSEAPYERYVIRVSPDNLHHGLAAILPRLESVYYIADTMIEEEFLRMDRHLSVVRKDAQVSACIGSMDLIFAYLISSETLIQDADYINEEIKKVLDYIDGHLAEIHCIDDLAAGLHLSRSSIYRLFATQLHTPIMTYIRTQQCLLARKYLAEGMPSADVALRLGFAHYSSFFRNYREVFHATPSEYA